MSYLGKVIVEDYDRALKEKALSRAINAVEKGKYLAVFTGGGFRLYDKTDYTLLIKETGMGYVYDGEFSEDLSLFAMKSWDGYVIFYNMLTGEKTKKMSLLDRKNGFDTSADRGCTFGRSSVDFFDVVYSQGMQISVINQYDTLKLKRIKSIWQDKHLVIDDIGYSAKEDAFWLRGYERINYRKTGSGYSFEENSKPFIAWTKDFSEKRISECKRFYSEDLDIFSKIKFNDASETFLIIRQKEDAYISVSKDGNVIT